MRTWRLKRKRQKFYVSIAAIIFLFATFPGKGGLEGGQREILRMDQRSDNWGFIVPFVYGNWPDLFGQWRFSLVFLQLSLFWVGLWFLLRDSWHFGRRRRLYIVFLVIFSSIFVSQLWRDATLLALATFGFGLLVKSMQLRVSAKVCLLSISVFVLHIAAMFKVLYGIVLGVIFLWLLIQSGLRKLIFFAPSVLIAGSISVLPYFIDKQFSTSHQLVKVFPEQQPIIFDLASSFCWGTSAEFTNAAARGLKIVLRPGMPVEATCASLRPNAWDNLHSNTSNIEWRFSSPLKRITGNQEERIERLRRQWINMIVDNPVDWIQVRMMYLGWTLILSNSFVPQNDSTTWEGALGNINEVLWNGFSLFAEILDKSRASSLFVAFVVVFISLVYSGFSSKGVLRRFFSHSRDPIIGLVVLLLTTGVTMVGFVASNGRYVLPYILLVYFCLVRARKM